MSDLRLLNIFEIKSHFKGFNLETKKWEVVRKTDYVAANDEEEALQKFNEYGNSNVVDSCEWYLPAVIV